MYIIIVRFYIHTEIEENEAPIQSALKGTKRKQLNKSDRRSIVTSVNREDVILHVSTKVPNELMPQ